MYMNCFINEIIQKDSESAAAVKATASTTTDTCVSDDKRPTPKNINDRATLNKVNPTWL